jgi:leader peptidase (prepilin peptidase)/N-methyltransferase
MPPQEPLLPLWAMELLANVFLWVWLFCMGATVGSFLNVVVYRLPRGLNLAFPGSLCPHCGHAIRLQDNIPILSWLNLRGRCRDCGGPISPRYFFVELTVAVGFLVVLAAEYHVPALGMGLRTRHVLLVRDGAPFWGMYFLHVTLATTLLGAMLLRSNADSVPATLFLPVIGVGLVLPLFWPEIRSVPAVGSWESHSWQAGLADGLAGLVGGAITGAMLIPLARRRGWSAAAVIAFCCCVAVVLGWQRGMVVALVAWAACEIIASALSKLSMSFTAKRAVPAEAASGSRIEEDDGPAPLHAGQTPLPSESEGIRERDYPDNAGQSGPA